MHHTKYGLSPLITQIGICTRKYICVAIINWFYNISQILILHNLLYFLTIKVEFQWFIVTNCYHLVLTVLTDRRFGEQNLNKPFIWCCKPSGESDIKIRSSAHNIWAIIISPMHTPNSVFRNTSKSAIYLRKSRPLATPPWLTPMALQIEFQTSIRIRAWLSNYIRPIK